MKIQYAIDTAPIELKLDIAKKIRDYIDIIELGEGMVMEYSLGIITMFKNIFPEKKILADLKIMDDGYRIAKLGFDAGADIVTTCVSASYGTQKGVVEAARDLKKESWIDFIGVPAERYGEYVDHVNELAPDYVCAHMSSDISTIGTEGHQDTKKVMIDGIASLDFKSKVVLSGGISVEDIDVIKACNPHHINVGSAFVKADDPVAVAKIFFEA